MSISVGGIDNDDKAKIVVTDKLRLTSPSHSNAWPADRSSCEMDGNWLKSASGSIGPCTACGPPSASMVPTAAECSADPAV